MTLEALDLNMLTSTSSNQHMIKSTAIEFGVDLLYWYVMQDYEDIGISLRVILTFFLFNMPISMIVDHTFLNGSRIAGERVTQKVVGSQYLEKRINLGNIWHFQFGYLTMLFSFGRMMRRRSAGYSRVFLLSKSLNHVYCHVFVELQILLKSFLMNQIMLGGTLD